MRVHELAKKLGIQSKEVLAALNDLGVELKSVHSAVGEEDAARVETSLSSSKVAKKTTKKVAKKTTKKVAKKTTEKVAKKTTKKVAKKTTKEKLVSKKKGSEKAPKITAVPDTISDPRQTRNSSQLYRSQKKMGRSLQSTYPSHLAPEPPAPMSPVEGTVTIQDGITVKGLAENLEMSPSDVMRELMSRGVMVNINQIA